MTDPTGLRPRAWFEDLRTTLAGQRQRRLVWLRGTADWVRATAVQAQRAGDRSLWVGPAGNGGDWQVCSWSATAARLGQEYDLVAWDARAGFDPDGFGQVVGLVAAGGLLLLQTPAMDAWLQRPDPAAERIRVDGTPLTAMTRRYLRRFCRLLESDTRVLIVDQCQPWPAIPPAAGPSHPGPDFSQQAGVVSAIVRAATGRRPRPVVLTADRGRGKSAALGLAAAALHAHQPGIRLVVTAPHRQQADAVYRHVPEHLRSAIPFHWPVELAEGRVTADTVLVDEAAAIGTALLDRMLAGYRRLVFATTVHGYEGSGRGFALRFQATLDAVAPGWQALRLQQPIRWAPDDPLEQLSFRALLLDAEPGAVAVPDDDRRDRHWSFRWIDQDALLADEALLRQVFGLLVQAHYRTRPLDLRNLLDGPGLRILLAEQGAGNLLGVALVAAEGGFPRALATAIWEGRRRPRGHLLAQGLAAHVGVSGAARLPVWRVMRLAVRPSHRRLGVGRGLLASAAEAAIREGQALIGTSFGATPELLGFWSDAGFHALRYGWRRDAASGCHSVLMVRALDRRGDWLLRQGQVRLQRALPDLLVDALAEAPHEALLAFLARLPAWPIPSASDRKDLLAFADAARSFEASLPALKTLAWWAVSDRIAQGTLDDGQRGLLVVRLLQAGSWERSAMQFSLPGRAGVVQALRGCVRALLSASGPSS